jgi:hypothetical protein
LRNLRRLNIIPNMKQEEHPLNLGKLLTNFQSLEFALRAFLVNEEIASGHSFPESINLYSLNEGDIVPENAFTNYDTLGQLIGKYNIHPRVMPSGLTIDEALVDIRDAIAHGRVAGDKPLPPFKLLKFDRPKNKNKHVKVTFSALLTNEWFSGKIADVQAAVFKVYEATKRLQSGAL